MRHWGRFLNADNYISTDTGHLGYNMYSYCNNNSIINKDPNGNISFRMMALIAGVGIAILANTVYQNKKAQKEINKVQKKKAPDKTKKLNDKMKKSVKELRKETMGQNPVKKLVSFTEVVKTGSKYDLKSTPEWQQTISYNGIIMEPQDIGNFHFGYIGRSMGYSTDFLTAGAGGYQLFEHWNDSVTYPHCFTTFFCDDPRDSYYIRLGAIAYDKEH